MPSDEDQAMALALAYKFKHGQSAPAKPKGASYKDFGLDPNAPEKHSHVWDDPKILNGPKLGTDDATRAKWDKQYLKGSIVPKEGLVSVGNKALEKAGGVIAGGAYDASAVGFLERQRHKGFSPDHMRENVVAGGKALAGFAPYGIPVVGPVVGGIMQLPGIADMTQHMPAIVHQTIADIRDPRTAYREGRLGSEIVNAAALGLGAYHGVLALREMGVRSASELVEPKAEPRVATGKRTSPVTEAERTVNSNAASLNKAKAIRAQESRQPVAEEEGVSVPKRKPAVTISAAVKPKPTAQSIVDDVDAYWNKGHRDSTMHEKVAHAAGQLEDASARMQDHFQSLADSAVGKTGEGLRRIQMQWQNGEQLWKSITDQHTRLLQHPAYQHFTEAVNEAQTHEVQRATRGPVQTAVVVEMAARDAAVEKTTPEPSAPATTPESQAGGADKATLEPGDAGRFTNEGGLFGEAPGQMDIFGDERGSIRLGVPPDLQDAAESVNTIRDWIASRVKVTGDVGSGAEKMAQSFQRISGMKRLIAARVSANPDLNNAEKMFNKGGREAALNFWNDHESGVAQRNPQYQAFSDLHQEWADKAWQDRHDVAKTDEGFIRNFFSHANFFDRESIDYVERRMGGQTPEQAMGKKAYGRALKITKGTGFLEKRVGPPTIGQLVQELEASGKKLTAAQLNPARQFKAEQVSHELFMLANVELGGHLDAGELVPMSEGSWPEGKVKVHEDLAQLLGKQKIGDAARRMIANPEKYTALHEMATSDNPSAAAIGRGAIVRDIEHMWSQRVKGTGRTGNWLDNIQAAEEAGRVNHVDAKSADEWLAKAPLDDLVNYAQLNAYQGATDMKWTLGASPKVAHIVDAAFSPSFRGSPIYDMLEGVNSFQLSLRYALGVRHAWNTGFNGIIENMVGETGALRKVASAAGGPVTMAANYAKGAAGIKQLMTTPNISDIPEAVRGYAEHGLLASGPYDQYRDQWQTVLDHLHDKKFVKAGFSAVRAATETAAYPLMNKWVPAQKLAAWLEQSEPIYAKMTAGEMTPDVGKHLLMKLADHIEDQMGEVNWDRYHIDNRVKDITRLLVSAPTWRGGTYRQFYGAVLHDLPTQALAAVTGTWKDLPPELQAISGRQQRVVLNLALTAVYGGLAHILMTRQMPTTLKDCIEPWNGLYDNRGNKQRVRIGTYGANEFQQAMKAAYTGKWSDVLGGFTDSMTGGLSPLVTDTADIATRNLKLKDWHNWNITASVINRSESPLDKARIVLGMSPVVSFQKHTPAEDSLYNASQEKMKGDPVRHALTVKIGQRKATAADMASVDPKERKLVAMNALRNQDEVDADNFNKADSKAQEQAWEVVGPHERAIFAPYRKKQGLSPQSLKQYEADMPANDYRVLNETMSRVGHNWARIHDKPKFLRSALMEARRQRYKADLEKLGIH